MKIIIFSDLHLGSGQSYGHVVNGFNSRINDFFNSALFILNYAKEHGIKKAIFAGDLYRTKNPNTEERMFFHQLLIKAQEWGIEITGIAGNHDLVSNNISAASPEGISLNYFSIFNQAVLLPLPGADFYLYPYSTFDPKKVSVDKSKRNVMIGHLTVSGSMIGHSDYIMDDEESFQISDFDSFDLVFLGHIHKPQTLGNKIHYIGSVDKTDISERDEVKRFFVYDLEMNTSLESIPIPNRSMYLLEVNLTKGDEFVNTHNNAIVKVDVTYDLSTREKAQALVKQLNSEGIFYSLNYINEKRDAKPVLLDYFSTVEKFIDTKVKEPLLNKKVKDKCINTLQSVMSEVKE
jgi:DNA repair exonuclease SbcCD nuclease subunit